MAGTMIGSAMWRRSRRRASTRPALEALEGRMLLYSTTGNAFADGRRITFSFMPDGTSTVGGQSHLFQLLDAKFARQDWVNTIETSFAQWEAIANVNLVYVNDNGASEGSGNVQQGSTQFGDIRIGAFDQGTGVAGFTFSPPKANGSSLSGDIMLNTNPSVDWEANGSGADLGTITMHEIGHALGLGHTTSSGAVMVATYAGQVPYPNSDDLAGIRAIWGPRAEDAYSQQYNNTYWTSAPDISSQIQQPSRQALINNLDIAGLGKSYWFKFTTPSNTSSTVSVTAQSTWLSELSPWVQIYNSPSGSNSNPTLNTQAYAAASAYGATVTASLSNATPNTTYYVRIAGSNNGQTGAGNYALLLNMGTSSQTPAPPPGILVYTQPDQGGGSINELVAAGRGGGFDPPDLIPTPSGPVFGDALPLGPAPTAAPILSPAPSFNVPHPSGPMKGHRPPQAAAAAPGRG